MFHLLGWYNQDNILSILENKKDSTLLIFHSNEDNFIQKLSFQSNEFIFIKTKYVIFNGKSIENGFLVYETKLNLIIYYLNSDPDIILANIKNTDIDIKNGLIISNIIKNDAGNDLIFFLSNIFGINCKLIGIDFEDFQSNSIFYKGYFYHLYFFLFNYDEQLKYEKIDDFWEDYLGPYIITEAFDGGFKNISWQNPIEFYIKNISSLSYQTIENSIKYFPLKIVSMKEDYSIIKLKMDFSKSIDLFYNDISIFSYQYAFIEKCNIGVLFNKIRKLKKIKPNKFFILSGDLYQIINEYLKNNTKIAKILSFKSFTGIAANLIVIPTKSIPQLTTNCVFAI